ncbi:MAG TPA: ECF-type sigma factor [Woeseiaceae bacterium]|nr:ECF-type sigma factor [Woeseiaceae bacterium]
MDKSQQRQHVQQLLVAIDRGEDGALAQLVELVYPDLKKLAHFQLAHERPGHTLNTTAIVHEAFVRLSGTDGAYKDRAHFLRAAATVTRHVLIDYARKRNAEKRGAGVEAMTLNDDRYEKADDMLAVLALDAAIKDMAKVDPTLEQVIECRYFAGLTVRETAEALNMSVRSVERAWQKGRAYLTTAMETAPVD